MIQGLYQYVVRPPMLTSDVFMLRFLTAVTPDENWLWLKQQRGHASLTSDSMISDDGVIPVLERDILLRLAALVTRKARSECNPEVNPSCACASAESTSGLLASSEDRA